MILIRDARLQDIPALHQIRVAVKENRLSDPSRIRPEDYELYLTEKGKGWVGEINGQVAGFAIVDTADSNVWALFVDPACEGQGLGRALHDAMLNWYFAQTGQTLWLSTAPGTRAEQFYRRAGWTATGLYVKGEVRFEMKQEDWHRGRRQEEK